MTRQEIIKILTTEGLSPNKMFGQNFLCDNNITDKIINTANPVFSDSVLEIGPGLGELTSRLSERCGSITSVEIDSGLYRFLSDKFKDNKKITLIHSDFLKTNLKGPFSKVIANLPYYCASEILFKCSEDFSPAVICVMLQKEMAERITAIHGTESYGAMTLSLSYHYESHIAFNVSSASFYPRPDVTSSVLLMKRRGDFDLGAKERQVFSSLVKGAFWGRRKTFVKACSSSPHIALSKTILLDALSHLHLNAAIRGEDMTVRQFVDLAGFIASHKDFTDDQRS
jgi:16S rRNA (adenine1518-N6/adenine1519-N6)-dimethyltransferase